MPKEIVQVKKTKVGIMEEMAYRKKSASLQTLPMDIVYPEKKDSVTLKEDTVQKMVGGKEARIIERH